MSCRLSWKIHFNDSYFGETNISEIVHLSMYYTVVTQKSAHEWSTYKSTKEGGALQVLLHLTKVSPCSQISQTTSSCRLSLFNIQAGWCTMAAFNQSDAMRVELKPNMMFTCHSYKPTNPHGPKK